MERFQKVGSQDREKNKWQAMQAICDLKNH